MAVLALNCGLRPLTQTATRFCSRLAYHDFNGPDPNERDAVIMRNQGLLSVGPTVAEAFTGMYRLERPCQAQIVAMACNTRSTRCQRPSWKSIGMYDPSVIRRYGLLEWPALRRKLDRRDPSFRD